MKVVCQGAHLKLCCAPPSPQDRGGVSFKYNGIVLLRRMHYLSRRLLSLRCSMRKRAIQSAVWGSEAWPDMSVAVHVNGKTILPFFLYIYIYIYLPSKSVMHIVPSSLFYSVSEDTFSHRSVITANSQRRRMYYLCVWKHLGVFWPIILSHRWISSPAGFLI